MERRRLRAAVDGADADQDVVGSGLRVLDEHVEVAVGVEDAGVEQLVFRIAARAPAVLGDEIGVRVGPLRILVEHPHVGMARDVVEVEVVLLHVLAVVALVPVEAEHPLLQDRVRAVPQRDGEARAAARSSQMPAMPSSPQR